MQYLNSAYTRRYNVRHKTFGHMFQGRYKALLVDGKAEAYFLTVSDYIHMNPVRAGLVRDGRDLLGDPWSSAGWLCGVRRGMPQWLEWRRVYGQLGIRSWRRGGRREYREYLERRVAEERRNNPRWRKIRRGWCYGAEGFTAEMKERLLALGEKDRAYDTWNDEASDELEQLRAERDLNRGLRILGNSRMEEVHGWDRHLLAEWVRSRHRVTIGWIGQRIGIANPASLSGGLYQLRKKIKTDRRITKLWERLESSKILD